MKTQRIPRRITTILLQEKGRIQLALEIKRITVVLLYNNN
jgi:hypothetical protein